MALTTTVTWEDLKASNREELDEVESAFDELVEHATEEVGEDWRERVVPEDEDAMTDEEKRIFAYQRQADHYDSAAVSCQNRLNMLDRLKEEYGPGQFEIKLLSGEETIDIETKLRMEADRKDIDHNLIQHKRNILTVDEATVDAPAGIPCEDDGPTPSQAPNALTLSLWDKIQRYNNTGQIDFQAAGCGDTSPSSDPTGDTSATPTPSANSSVPSVPDDATSQASGEDS